MKQKTMTPLFALAAAMAYVSRVDGHTGTEEKARITSILSRHVSTGDITADRMKELARDAFELAATVPLESFLAHTATLLTPAQKISVALNVIDVMMADGRITDGERLVAERFAIVYRLEPGTLAAVRSVLLAKNDTGIFTNPSHPRNHSDGDLGFSVIDGGAA